MMYSVRELVIMQAVEQLPRQSTQDHRNVNLRHIFEQSIYGRAHFCSDTCSNALEAAFDCPNGLPGSITEALEMQDKAAVLLTVGEPYPSLAEEFAEAVRRIEVVIMARAEQGFAEGVVAGRRQG